MSCINASAIVYNLVFVDNLYLKNEKKLIKLLNRSLTAEQRDSV